MNNIIATELSAKQLRRAASLKEKIDALQTELSRFLGSSDNAKSNLPVKGKRRGPSKAGRARIAAAAKARWAKVRKEKKAKARDTKVAE